MNEFGLLAFVVMPALVVLMGYVAMRLHERTVGRFVKEQSRR
jgi:hypothetical protein